MARKFQQAAKTLEPDIIAWRRDFHAHPELSLDGRRQLSWPPVLPHGAMLPTGVVVRFSVSVIIDRRRLWACGRRRGRWATRKRCPRVARVRRKAHRPNVHSLPGAPAPDPPSVTFEPAWRLPASVCRGSDPSHVRLARP